MFKEKIQPSLVLTLICLITCALLVIAHDATYKDNTGVITDDMLASLEEIYGTSNGFTMKLDENGAIYAPEGITCVLKGLTFGKLPKASEDDDSPKKFVWGSADEIEALKEEAASAPVSDTFELDAITGATFSSNGTYRAVTLALNAYNEMEGVTVSE